MEIKLKSNRKFIMNLTYPFIITYGILMLLLIYEYFIGNVDVSKDFGWILSTVIILVLLIAVLFIAKDYKGKNFIFKEQSIEIYKKDVFIKEIKIKDIVTMHYYPFRFHFIFTIFLGALNEGGARKIHILDINETRHEIGFICEKDAIVLQEKLYPGLLEIMYDKRKK